MPYLLFIFGVDLEEFAQRPESYRLTDDLREQEFDLDDYTRHGERFTLIRDPYIDFRRETAMAARLKILLSRHKKVLFVGGLAHWTSITALLGDDAVRPAELLIRNSKPPGKRVIIHPSMAVNYMDHFPVMSTLYEAWREFEQAERIYRHLEKMNFELPGTLCHLARVQILLLEYDKARVSADRAWTHRKQARNYVLPRIIYFKILFCLLDKQSPSVWLRRIKKALQKEDVIMDWDLMLMLEIVRPDLTPEAFRFMQLLGDALQNPQNWEYQKVRISEYQNAFKTP